ncbi:MAG TPA: hypothetical protein VEZ46_11855 [Mycobacteriales bacterium]|nr:hypothetical protein [Mycobacteriales bacterium]
MRTPARTLSRVTGRVMAARRPHGRRATRDRVDYFTPADRIQIDALIRQHTPEQTRQVDEILNHQRAR